MWADLKMNHAATVRIRGEMLFIALAVAAIAVLLWTMTSIARDQVHKAELRNSLLQSQRTATARCWQEAPGPLAMRSCMADVQGQTAQAVDQSYGLAQQPEDRDTMRNSRARVTANVSTASMRY